MGAVEDAVDAGPAWHRFHLDGVEGEAVPDVVGEDADTPVIDGLPWIDGFIEDDIRDGYGDCSFHIFFTVHLLLRFNLQD